MLRLYEITNPKSGYVFKQLTEAWRKYLPNVEWVSSENKADFVIIEAIGGEEYVQALTVPGHKRILFQMCVYTSGVSIPDWKELWDTSHVTLSFHDLPSYLPESERNFKFVRTPLGADPNDFPLLNLERNHKIFTTGHVASTEHIDDIFRAIQSTKDKMYHTGENFRYDTNYYKFLHYMTIPELSRLLNSTQYVIGLRDIEGFEVHCIQGAMCGATPIVPNLPTYDFYQEFGTYIDMQSDVRQQLVEILSQPYEPLAKDKVEMVRYYFSWQRIMNDLASNIF